MDDPSVNIKPPKIEKKMPDILTIEEVNRLLDQPGDQSPKEIRDRAMLELLYATGIRVSELVTLNAMTSESRELFQSKIQHSAHLIIISRMFESICVRIQNIYSQTAREHR